MIVQLLFDGMAQEFNPNLYPPFGYEFHERDGSIIRASGWKQLERKVREYRERNRFEVGDPWQEIMAQVCARVPGHCRNSEPPKKTRTGTGLTFNQRVLAWAAWALGRKRVNDWSEVSSEEANRRAAICATCPKQKSLNLACTACVATLTRARRILRNERESEHQNLFPCAVLGEDCVSTVHANLSPSSNPDLPAHCWRRG